jgi:16S rRNA G966 N2-methylase RsmD
MLVGYLDKLPDIIVAPRSDPIYNCHAYLTKVPIAAIQPFIEAFTQPGDIVADFFAGSGMTGLAALRLGRRARLSDISVLGKHIAIGYLTDISGRSIRDAANEVIKTARQTAGSFYMTERSSDCAHVELVRTVWSFTYACPACKFELVYFEHLDRHGNPPKNCPRCREQFERRKWVRLQDVPVQVVVRGVDKRQLEQRVSDYDRRQLRDASLDSRQRQIPSLPIDESREMYSRSGLGKVGMTETGKFFSSRNAIALLELWRAINQIEDEKIQRKLRFAFTAILPRASMRYQWSAKRPLNAQNQTYYIAPVYYEWNVFELFDRKISAVIRATEELFEAASLLEIEAPKDVTYHIASADRLGHLESESVDYVFTDPPFGSNIFYSDMNLFHEAWLGEITDQRLEAVIHTTGKRKNGSAERYQKLLHQAFDEAFRILRPGGYISVVFGNSSGAIWGLVQKAIRDAGFSGSPVHVAILDKGQRSVKGLNSGSESVVTVDLILTLQKPSHNRSVEDPRELVNGDRNQLISDVIREVKPGHPMNPSYVYAKVLRKAIEQHFALDSLHFADVLIALRNAGYGIDHKTGLFSVLSP